MTHDGHVKRHILVMFVLKEGNLCLFYKEWIPSRFLFKILLLLSSHPNFLIFSSPRFECSQKSSSIISLWLHSIFIMRAISFHSLNQNLIFKRERSNDDDVDGCYGWRTYIQREKAKRSASIWSVLQLRLSIAKTIHAPMNFVILFCAVCAIFCCCQQSAVGWINNITQRLRPIECEGKRVLGRRTTSGTPP